MKNLILTILVLFSFQVLAEVENEVVTDAQFKANTKANKAANKKYDAYAVIPNSSSLVSGKHAAGSKFRIHIAGSSVSSAKAMGKSFNFAYYEDDPAFPHSGYGFYAVKCDVMSCLKHGYYENETYTANDSVGTFKTVEVLKVSGFEAIVEYTGKNVETVNERGQKLVLPVIRVVEAY